MCVCVRVSVSFRASDVYNGDCAGGRVRASERSFSKCSHNHIHSIYIPISIQCRPIFQLSCDSCWIRYFECILNVWVDFCWLLLRICRLFATTYNLQLWSESVNLQKTYHIITPIFNSPTSTFAILFHYAFFSFFRTQFYCSIFYANNMRQFKCSSLCVNKMSFE